MIKVPGTQGTVPVEMLAPVLRNPYILVRIRILVSVPLWLTNPDADPDPDRSTIKSFFKNKKSEKVAKQ